VLGAAVPTFHAGVQRNMPSVIDPKTWYKIDDLHVRQRALGHGVE
jgi:hypothetical protein